MKKITHKAMVNTIANHNLAKIYTGKMDIHTIGKELKKFSFETLNYAYRMVDNKRNEVVMKNTIENFEVVCPLSGNDIYYENVNGKKCVIIQFLDENKNLRRGVIYVVE